MRSMVCSLALSLCLVFAGCGGGGGGGHSSAPASNTGGSTTNSASSYSVSGVAATGNPIIGRIYIKDAAGHEQFVDTNDGTYQFTLTNFVAPFLLKAEWVVNSQTLTLYSFSPDSGVANITPLTQMAMIAAAGTTDLTNLYSNPTNLSAIETALPTVIADLKKSMMPLLTKFNVTATDIFTTPFVPDHSGFDALLDSIDVNFTATTVVVTDKNSGAVVLNAPVTQLAQAFTAPDWSSADASVANDPDMAVDSNGRALVVWSEYVSNHYVIRARFLDADSASAIAISNAGDAGMPRVIFDAGNNALAVWAQYQNNRNTIWSSRYNSTAHAWSTAQQISTNTIDDAYYPIVAADASGNAIVAWYEGDGRNNHFDAWFARFAIAQNHWNTPQLVSDGVNSAYRVQVAMNAAGEGLLAWEQEQGDGTMVSNGPKDIYGRSISNMGALGASARLNAVAGNIDWVYGQISVAVDVNGNGGAVWVQSNGEIHAAMFSANHGWQTSSPITTNPPGNAYSPQIAFDGNGNAIAVWQQQTGATAYGASNRYVVNSGWGTAVQFASDNNGDVYDPHIAVDAAGNATAVWYQWAMTPTNLVTVNTARYTVNSGWGAEHLFANTNTDGGMSYPVPRVASNAAGQMTAVWGVDSY